MKTVYERTALIITEFDAEDVITTSGQSPDDPEPEYSIARDNSFRSFNSFRGPGSWF